MEHYRCEYDIEGYIQSFYDTGLLNESGAWTKCTIRTILTGNNYQLDFLRFAKALMAKHGRPINGSIDDDIWEMAGEQYDFQKTFDYGKIEPDYFTE